MTSFQSPCKLVLVFIAIWITQFSFILSQTTTVQCIDGFAVKSPAYFSACNNKDFSQWICPTASCQKDGHRWAPMKNCVLEGVAGTSSQQCTTYGPSAGGKYECYNASGKRYLCPYTAANVPYITCTECTMPKSSTPKAQGSGKASSGGPIMITRS